MILARTAMASWFTGRSCASDNGSANCPSQIGQFVMMILFSQFLVTTSVPLLAQAICPRYSNDAHRAVSSNEVKQALHDISNKLTLELQYLLCNLA